MSPQAFGSYLREMMLERGLTTRTVSDRSARAGQRLMPGTINHLLSGKTPNPGIHTIELLANALDMEPTYLMFAFAGLAHQAAPIASPLCARGAKVLCTTPLSQLKRSLREITMKKRERQSARFRLMREMEKK